jgi:outer membrane protein OmpA-like peptidoglycan-associated protein
MATLTEFGKHKVISSMSSVSSEVDKADGTEVDVVTHCDELQVDKANRTEVEVVTNCDELQVNKSDRTEVEVVTHCDEHFSSIGLIHL